MPSIVERRSPAETDTALAGLLLSTLPRLGRLVAQQHEPGTLSWERLRVLWPLRQGPFRSGELAQKCSLTAPALSELVDSLEREGLVRRIDDRGDRRVVLVEITARGRREMDRSHDLMTERVAQLLATLSVEKRARLRSALADLQEAIEALSKESTRVR